MVTSDSIRQRIYKLWTKNPYITAKPACKKLNLNYKKHGSYIRKELSQFRSYHKFGLPQKALNPHRRIFVWENVPRSLLFCGDMCRSLEKLGWSEVSNRNGMWIFRDDRGSVHWYKGGLFGFTFVVLCSLLGLRNCFVRLLVGFRMNSLSSF